MADELKRILCYIIIAVIVTSCASQVTPTGGPKDVTPPKVEKASPHNLSTNFSSQKIDLTFDEYTQLNDPATQIYFSPALDSKPVFRLHGKTLVISQLGILKSNTTYSVSFGSAIKDLTEGNIMLNYQYVFSTGAYIDSFKIKGILKDVYGKTDENFLVMLYSDLDDSAVAKHRPTYNARTDKSGNFSIEHVKEGTYRLFALEDLNFNMLYDQSGEEIAFLDSPITISDTLGFYSLTMFKPYPGKQKLVSAESHQPGRVMIALARPSENLQVTCLSEKNLQGISEYNSTKDTITWWVHDFTSDSLRLLIADKNFSDTVTVRMKKEDARLHIAAPGFSINTDVSNIGPLPNQPITLTFSTPLVSVNENKKILLLNDSAKTKSEATVALITDTLSGRKSALVHAVMEEKIKYTLIIPDSAFRDVYDRFSDSARIHFVSLALDEVGNLKLKVMVADSSQQYFYELRNKAGALLSKNKLKPGLNSLLFTSMLPGNYSLSVIDDANRNNRWDTGDYWKHLQPERIIGYPGNITLRANWDIDVQMNVGKK